MLPSPTGLRDPHRKSAHVRLPLLLGEGWGEGEHTALVVILRAALLLLFMNHCGSLSLQVER